MKILRLNIIGEKLTTSPFFRDEIPHPYLRFGHGIGMIDRKNPTLRREEDLVEYG
jgi:hypothetical protein